jgi:hypothetical protein
LERRFQTIIVQQKAIVEKLKSEISTPSVSEPPKPWYDFLQKMFK